MQITAFYAALLAARGASVVVSDSGTGFDGSGSDDSVAEQAASELRQTGGEFGRVEVASGGVVAADAEDA